MLTEMAGRWITLACIFVLSLAVPAEADADVREGFVGDPRDQPGSVSGPARPDVEQVRVRYDQGGSVWVTFRFFESLYDTSSSSRRLQASVGSTTPNGKYDPPGGGCVTYNSGDVTVFADVYPEASYQAATVSGFDGSITGSRSVSPDGRELALVFSHAALAGRDYRCVDSLSTFIPDFDGHCSPSINNCERISYRYTEDLVDRFFFAGFTPPPRPACSNGIDDDADGEIDSPLDPGCVSDADNDEANPACSDGRDNDGDGKIDLDDPSCSFDERGSSEGRPPTACGNRRDDDGDGKTDRKDPGCRGRLSGTTEEDPRPVASRMRLTLRATKCRIDTRVEVQPDLFPAKVFPFRRVVLVLKRGSLRVVHRPRLGVDRGYRFGRLKVGRYRVTARYPGDKWRLKSKRVSRRVKITGRHCSRRRTRN